MSETRSWSRFDPEAYQEYVEGAERAKQALQPWIFKPQQAATAFFGLSRFLRGLGALARSPPCL